MALLINSTCVNCDMCEPECPNEAIIMGEKYYEIIPDKCTECIGYYDEPQCQKVCPIDKCVIQHPEHIEDEQSLWNKFAQLDSINQVSDNMTHPKL